MCMALNHTYLGQNTLEWAKKLERETRCPNVVTCKPLANIFQISFFLKYFLFIFHVRLDYILWLRRRTESETKRDGVKTKRNKRLI